MTMQATYQNAFEDSQKDDMKREEEAIVVDLMPPQYQLSTPSPPSPTSVNAQRTPESINDNGKFHIGVINDKTTRPSVRPRNKYAWQICRDEIEFGAEMKFLCFGLSVNRESEFKTSY